MGNSFFSQLSPRMQKMMIEEEKRQQEHQARWEAYVKAEEEKARKRRRAYQLQYENIPLFFLEEGLYVWDPEGKITSVELYAIYKQWCLEQEIPLHPPREFWLYAKNNSAKYRLVYSTYIPDQNGKRCRGFYGIRSLEKEEKSTTLQATQDGADGTHNHNFPVN